MIRIRQIKIDVLDNCEENLVNEIKKRINNTSIINYEIVKKSLDARKKDHIFYVYEVDVNIKNEKEVLKKYGNNDLFLTPNEEYIFPKGFLNERPVIIGSGPAGLMCAYILAENGYNPIIYERGCDILERILITEKFFQKGVLDPDCNVQFGCGGAGTFSDGKLNTLVKDKLSRGKKVFQIFVKNGAPKEILYENNPHIGTDVIRKVILNIKNSIIKMGGEINFNSKLNNLIIKDNRLEGIVINDEIISCHYLVLAIGHSARDTFQMLNDNKLNMIPKPFAVGLRIMHKQEMININQYGKKYYKLLPPASYKLTYTTKSGRGVYSFCMCPGGYVVNSSSEKNHLAINGMSNYKRDTKWANSAIVVTISPKDFGSNPLDGIKFQRNLEQNAYNACHGKIPVNMYADYLKNQESKNIPNDLAVKGEYFSYNLNKILPKYINDSLKEGINNFGNKIKGYDGDEAILLGVETRTSSPLRILRDDNGVSNITGIYPCGEGAGYSGGITSSCMDGIKIAELLVK